MKLLLQLTALACMACLGAAGIEVALLAHNYAKVPLSALVSSANGSLTHLNGVLENADGAISQIRDTATKEAASYDPKLPGSIPNQVYRLTVDAKHLIGTTDRSINGDNGRGGAIQSVSAGLGAALASTQQLEATAATSLSKTSEAIDPILASLASSSDALAKQMPPMLANVLETSRQTAIIAQHSANATAEVDMTAHDVRQVADAFRSDYLQPKNRLWFYFKTLIGIGANAGNIAGLAR